MNEEMSIRKIYLMMFSYAWELYLSTEAIITVMQVNRGIPSQKYTTTTFFIHYLPFTPMWFYYELNSPVMTSLI